MTSGSPESSWSYIEPFDGLRALAVTLVVLFHFWEDQFLGGFIGVDVFFAMSGYLITAIAIEERRTTGSVDLKAFWVRRVRRLVPAVWFIVAVCAVWVAIVETSSVRMVVDSVGALTWTTNWLELGFSGSQAFVANPNAVLDHLWSLAIEEQFYIVWPLVLLAMFRWQRTTTQRLFTTIGLGLCSVIAMGFSEPLTGYFSTHTRAFELLAGAALALWGKRLGSAGAKSAIVVGLVGVLIAMLFADPGASWMYPWGFLGVAATSIALVAGLAGDSGVWARPFTQPMVRHVGRVSYGIYLWHLPIYRLISPGRVGFDGVGLVALRFVVLAAFVEFSYRLIEQPIRSKVWTPSMPAIGAAFAVLLVAMAPMGSQAWDDYGHRWDSRATVPKVESGDRKVLVVGDLLAATVARGLSDSDGLAVYDVSDIGCAFGDGGFIDSGEVRYPDAYCKNWPTRWKHAVDEFEPDIIVVSAGFWDLGPRYDPEGREVSDGLKSDLYAEATAEMAHVLGVAHAEIVVVAPEELTPLAERNLGSAVVTERENGEWVAALTDAFASAQPTLYSLPAGSEVDDALTLYETELASSLRSPVR